MPEPVSVFIGLDADVVGILKNADGLTTKSLSFFTYISNAPSPPKFLTSSNIVDIPSDVIELGFTPATPAIRLAIDLAIRKSALSFLSCAAALSAASFADLASAFSFS